MPPYLFPFADGIIDALREATAEENLRGWGGVDMPYDKSLAIVPCAVSGEYRNKQNRVQKCIDGLRQTEKIRKELLEELKSEMMYEYRDRGEDKGQDKKFKEERRRWLQDVYVPSLRSVGARVRDLEDCLPSFAHLVELPAGGGAAAPKYSIRVKADQKPLFDIYEGEAAFELDPAAGAVARPVYRKRGANKQYVKDDLGRFTRRYAFAEKSMNAFVHLIMADEMVGKSVHSDLGGDPFAKGPFAKSKYEYLESGDADRMTARELAFVNQEDGSTTQRALALASTAKPLHGNEGYRFGRFNGVLLEIDLAAIPVNEDQLLLNLYSFDAQTGPDDQRTLGLETYNLKGGGKRGNLKATAAESKEHTDWSTSKNRELSLLKLPIEAVRRVVFHDADYLDLLGDFARRSISQAGATQPPIIEYKPLDACRAELYPEST